MRQSALLFWLLCASCTPEVSVIENEAEGDDPGECSDGADNDKDGDFNCDDDDCQGSPECRGGSGSSGSHQDSGGANSDSGGGGSDSGGGSSNTPPSEPGIAVVPTCADTDEDITCRVTAESVDPDGDTVSYSYAWSSDSGRTASGEVLQQGRTSGGEEWTCTVTPSDGASTGLPGSASVPIYGPCRSRLDTSFDSGAGRWDTLGGAVSSTAGYVELVRTREQWAAARWDSDTSLEGSVSLSATLSVHADQGIVGACVTDGNTSTGITIPGLDGQHGRGYCLLLSSETQNGSSRGAFLRSGDVTGNLTILAEQTFTPATGQKYILTMERTCSGDITFWLDGGTVGVANNTAAASFSRLLLVG